LKTNNIILEKSYNFALRTIKLYMHLKKQKAERELIIQLLKSGTSIGQTLKRRLALNPGVTLFIKWDSPTRKQEKLHIGFAFLLMQKL
jgi:hypothetical protein